MKTPNSNLPPDLPPMAAPQAADFKAIYYALLSRAWLIVLFMLIAGLAAGIYVMKAQRVFEAQTTIQVEQQEDRVVQFERVLQEDLRSQEILKTIEQTLTSIPLLERVVASENLANDPRFTETLGERDPVERLYSMVQARLRRGTRLIDIRVEHPNAEITALVANSIVQQYLRLGVEHHAGASRMANVFLLDEAERLRQRLEESEEQLQAYKEETGSVSLEERQNVIGQRLREISQQATIAKEERIRLETQVEQIRRHGTNVQELLSVPLVGNDLVVKQIEMSIARLESEFANLRQRYLHKHPRYIQAQSQIEQEKAELETSVLRIPRRIESAYESALANEKALNAAQREQEALALELSRQAVRYNVLSRELESERALYASVLNRLKETTLTQDLQSENVRIHQPAYVPARPFKPKRAQVLMGAILAGLIGGVLLAMFLNAMDSSIKGVDDAEEFIGLPVLTTVHQIRDLPDGKALVAAEDSKSTAAESFRTLRTSLSMLGRAEDRRSFLFVSALPAEGKTFCSVNYAVSLAQQGLRTLIIDADLRRCAVEKALFGTESGKPGVTDYLTAQKKFGEIVHDTPVPKLSYIAAGTDAPNPSELLGQKGFDSLMDEAMRDFDRVVVDCAPVHAVSDALLILGNIQTVCLVVRANRTPRKSVMRAVQLLEKAGAPLGGIILNRLPRRLGTGYYYYDPYYDYTYSGAYTKGKVYGAK